MEVARAPGGFLMPHQMYHHERRLTNPAPAAAAAGEGPRRIRMRTPHAFYDGTMVATPSVDVDVDDDDSAPASFTAWIDPTGGLFRGVPAAASAVAGLPEATVAAGGDGEETCCAVCLEGYAGGDTLRTMPCAHAFHAACIVEWLSVSRFCPLCRFRLPSQAEDDAGGQRQEAARPG